MHLRPDWKLVLRRAWSVRFAALATGAATADGILQAWLSGITTNVVFILGIGALCGGVMVARLIAQENLPHG